MKRTQFEGSKLLAEFMEAKLNPVTFIVDPEYIFSKSPSPEYAALYWSVGVMEYHSSWDWLIPVYQKFYKIISDRGGHTWFAAMELKQRFSGYVAHGTTEEAFGFLAAEIRKFNNQERPY